MGHLRTGGIPKTRKWRDLVLSISSLSGVGDIPYDEIAKKTLDASNIFLRKLPYDETFQCCFQFLVTLSIAGKKEDVSIAAKKLGINIDGNPTKLKISKALRGLSLKMDRERRRRFCKGFLYRYVLPFSSIFLSRFPAP